MPSNIYLYLSIAIAVLPLQLAHGNTLSTATSLDIKNLSPVISLFNIAGPDYQKPLKPGEFSYKAQLEVSNYISLANHNTERFFIDGETWSLRQRLDYQLDNWHLSAQAPLIYHGPGLLDAAIYRFHDIFDMPQNGRSKIREDELDWQLESQGQTLIQINNEQFSLGDLALSAKHNLNMGAHVFGLHIKLPTGQFDKQSGSGGVDIGLSYSSANPAFFQEREFLKDWPLALWWGASINYLSQAPKLKVLKQNSWVAAARLGLSWQAFDKLYFKLQLDSHSPVFNSNTRELGWVPIISTVALNYQHSRDQSFELSIVEDLRPRVTPDISILLSYQTSF